MVTGIVYLGLSKVLSKEESLELDSDLRLSVDILQLLAGSECHDRQSDETERAFTNRFKIMF